MVHPLEGIDLQEINIVVIGYTTCPYSLRSLDLISQLNIFREHFKFISFGSHNTQSFFHSVDNFKTHFHYSGTFPLIFIRKDNSFKYIGGFTQLESYIKKKMLGKIK